MGQRARISFSSETVILTSAVGGTIPTAPVGADVPRVQNSVGKMRLRFAVDTANVTIGDGTYAHVIAIVGRIDASANWELLGFAGINLGGVAPQIPLRFSDQREFSMLVDVDEGYNQIGLCGFAAAESVGALNTLTCRASWVCDDRGGAQ